MASALRLCRTIKQGQTSISDISTTSLLLQGKYVRKPVRNQVFLRNASLASQGQNEIAKATHFQIPRWMVYVLAPSAVLMYGILQITSPDEETTLTKKMKQGLKASKKTKSLAPTCTEVHAPDLDNWIKTHPDEIDEAHAVGWNKMYNAFTEHAEKAGEPARIEAENARLLAGYARKEDNILRSTKEHGRMSTLGANKNIGDPAKKVRDGVQWSFTERVSENMAARIEQAKRRFTKATKGRAFGDA